MLYYDVSLHILVELVVVISTSLRTSKTEFGCKSYDRFRIRVFCSFLSGGSTATTTAKTAFGCTPAVVPPAAEVLPLPGSCLSVSNFPGGGSTAGSGGSTAPARLCPQRLDIWVAYLRGLLPQWFTNHSSKF